MIAFSLNVLRGIFLSGWPLPYRPGAAAPRSNWLSDLSLRHRGKLCPFSSDHHLSSLPSSSKRRAEVASFLHRVTQHFSSFPFASLWHWHWKWQSCQWWLCHRSTAVAPQLLCQLPAWDQGLSIPILLPQSIVTLLLQPMSALQPQSICAASSPWVSSTSLPLILLTHATELVQDSPGFFCKFPPSHHLD